MIEHVDILHLKGVLRNELRLQDMSIFYNAFFMPFICFYSKKRFNNTIHSKLTIAEVKGVVL
jgi:hypothetical protein